VNDWLGLPFDLVRVRQGDSDEIPTGSGTSASRSLLMGGLAIKQASEALIETARGHAARLMQAESGDLTFDNGDFTIASTDGRIGLAEVGRAAAEAGEAIAASGNAAEAPPTYSNGCHVCELLVDPETGELELRNYTAVDDFGRVLNPLLCAGQIHGGVAQGIGQALMEGVVYDSENGQLLTGSLLDYGLPRADDMPSINIEFVEDRPCLTNVMGVKGAAEIGAIAAPPAIINALLDALAPLGVRDIDMPATPERVWRAIRQAADT
jgi:carbon-monoxide dehydrogenase large subunit